MQVGHPSQAVLGPLPLPRLLAGENCMQVRQIDDIMAQLSRERRKPSSAPVEGIPPILSQFIEGRNNDLATLQGYLDECRLKAVFSSVAVSGFPGAGKTSLVLQLAHLCAQKTPRDFFPVLWICASGPDKIDQDVGCIATELGILPESTHPAERGLRAKKELLSWLASPGSLYLLPPDADSW